MNETKATIVIISGAWHPPNLYSKLSDTLRVEGFDVHIPALPSVSDVQPPAAGLVGDTSYVRAMVEDVLDQDKHIIAIAHSYGGQVGSNAFHGLGVPARAAHNRKGGVLHLVYLCASMLAEGGSMFSLVQELGQPALLPQAIDFAYDTSCVPKLPDLVVGDVANETEKQAYVEDLRRWNCAGMYEPVQKAAWREIPSTYVYTSNDSMIPLHFQQTMVQRAQVEISKESNRTISTVQLAAGHCPNLSNPKEVTEIVVDIASKF